MHSAYKLGDFIQHKHFAGLKMLQIESPTSVFDFELAVKHMNYLEVLDV